MPSCHRPSQHPDCSGAGRLAGWLLAFGIAAAAFCGLPPGATGQTTIQNTAGTDATAPPEAPIRLRIVGGAAGFSLYYRHEAPFWTQTVPAITGGRVQAEIMPFGGTGLSGQKMLHVMRLGVVPFGRVALSAAAEEPELDALDLPVLNPDLATLRRNTALWRPRLQALLRDRHGIELLAIYLQPAQVMFCRRPFSGLADLAGRRIRTSSVGQSELVAGLGATPVVTAIADLVPAIRSGAVECAITGTLSGNAIGLHEVTTHVSHFALGWGISLFGASLGAWNALPEPIRDQLRTSLEQLQKEVWQAAEQETEVGLACNTGRPDCATGRRGAMTLVAEPWRDEAKRVRILLDIVLPAWERRCGPDCGNAWNSVLAPSLGIRARTE